VKAQVLAVLERAYRGALEEQYAHVLWMLLSLLRLGGGIAVLLRGNAALYARRGQAWPALDVAGIRVPPPEYEAGVAGLLETGGSVFVMDADLGALGLTAPDLCAGVTVVTRDDVGRLFSSYASVWYL